MYSPNRPAPQPTGNPYLPPSHPFALSYTPPASPVRSTRACSPASSPPPPRRPAHAKYPTSPAAMSVSSVQSVYSDRSALSSVGSVYSSHAAVEPVTPTSSRFQRGQDGRYPESPLSRNLVNHRPPIPSRFDSLNRDSTVSPDSYGYSHSDFHAPPSPASSVRSTDSLSRRAGIDVDRKPSPSLPVAWAAPSELNILDHRPRQNLLGDLEYIVGKKFRFPLFERFSEQADQHGSGVTQGKRQSRSDRKKMERDAKLEKQSAMREVKEKELLGGWKSVGRVDGLRLPGRGVREGNWI